MSRTPPCIVKRSRLLCKFQKWASRQNLRHFQACAYGTFFFLTAQACERLPCKKKEENPNRDASQRAPDGETSKGTECQPCGGPGLFYALSRALIARRTGDTTHIDLKQNKTNKTKRTPSDPCLKHTQRACTPNSTVLLSTAKATTSTTTKHVRS